MAEITNSTTYGQIQKKSGGHIHDASLLVLTQAGFLPSWGAEDKGEHEHYMRLPNSNLRIEVAEHRIKDIISNVRDGYADWGIVSTDGIERWQSAQSEVCAQDCIFEIADLGLSGCCPMLLLPREYAEQNWETLIKQAPIVTSNKSMLDRFLRQHGIADFAETQIIEREGGTEATARRIIKTSNKPVMLFDLVATGKSAFTRGFVPAKAGDKDATFLAGEENKMILIRSSKKENVALNEFCETIATDIEKIRQRVLRLYVDILTTASQEASNPDIRDFASARIKQLTATNG